jgi:hypothetical protein
MRIGLLVAILLRYSIVSNHFVILIAIDTGNVAKQKDDLIGGRVFVIIPAASSMGGMEIASSSLL